MRVVHVLSNDAPGGLNQAAIRLHEGLLHDGVDSVLCLRRIHQARESICLHGPRSRRFQKAWEVARAKIDAVPVRFWSGKSYLSLSWLPTTLHRSLAQLRPDVVHVHQPHTANMTLGTLRRVRAALVATLHDMWFLTGGCTYAGECRRYESNCGNCPKAAFRHSYDASRIGWLMKKLRYPLDRMAFVAPSAWMYDAAMRSTLLRDAFVSVIPYGIDVDAFARRPVANARARFGVPVGGPVIGMIADRLPDPRKGLDLGFAAIRRIATELGPSGLRVLVAGRGSGVASDGVGCSVQYLGPLQGDGLLDFYSALDFLILPSREDNLPNVGIEASASGTPVLGFRIGGLPDIAANARRLLATPFDVCALSQLAIDLLRAPSLLEEVRSQTKQHASKGFAIRQCVSRHVDLYQQMIAVSPS